LDFRNQSHNHTRDIAARSALLIACLLYFVIGLSNLGLPGLEYDEAADAVPAMEMLTGQPVSSLSTFTLFGRQLPLMMLHHIGPSTIFTSYAGMALLGISAQALRASQLAVGAIALVLLWLMARRWFDDLTAIIATLLCATAPAFIWWNRAGANWTAPLLPLALGTLLLLRHWWHTRRPTALAGAAFLFGAGFVTKILFIWLVAPIALTALLVLGVSGLWRALRGTRVTTLALAAAALIVGLGPFILHNIQSPLATFQFLASNALTTKIYSHNNLDVLNNLRIVIGEFVVMMGGDTMAFRAPAGLLLGAFALVGSVIYLAALCVRYRALIPYRAPHPADAPVSPGGLRLRLFLLLCVVTILPLSTISTSGIGATYLFILAPLAWLLIAVSLRDGIIWLHTHWDAKRGAWVGGAIVAAIALNQVGTNVAIHLHFRQTGGIGLWSDAIFTVARELDTQYAARPIIAMDWGFERSVAFLTRGRVHTQEVFEFLPQPSSKFDDMATVLLRNPANVYVFHAPETTAFRGYREAFERNALKAHKTLNVVETIYERNGDPNTLFVIAEETPRSFTLSPILATRKATFDGGLTLLGGQASYDPARREVAVELYWQSTADQQPDDTVLLHIVDQSNGKVAQVGDVQPVYGSYPFTRWQRGEVVTDPHWVSLPADLPPGVYQVRVGVYDRATGARRAIQDPQNDAAGNSLMLNSFEIK
jgi:4-amino-4-deoxy-L-arabinose transferase-like glycosyltransferase